jgi:hypothetical protein
MGLDRFSDHLAPRHATLSGPLIEERQEDVV